MKKLKYNLKIKKKAEFKAADTAVLEASKRLSDNRWNNKNYINKLRIKSKIGAGILMLIASLTSVKRINWQAFKKAYKSPKPMLIVAWHGSFIVPVYSFRNKGIFILTSLSGDGDMLTHTLYNFGFRCIRGSSSRGGMRGLLEMVKIMKQGANCAITVDGPRGPRHEVKPGAVLLAQKSNALILPIATAYSKCHKLNNWDKTEIPLPGSKSIFVIGNPFTISSNISLEEGCSIIKNKITACENEALKRVANA